MIYSLPTCPFCGKDSCSHHVGWTEDGIGIQLKHANSKTAAIIQTGDRIVTTGVSARVYRKAARK